MQELYCGIDIGTSSTKAVVYDAALQPVFSEARHYDFVVPEQDRVELDPDEVYQAAVTCLEACARHAAHMGAPLGFIAFSSALHSFIAVDAAGRPLTNYITWADMRATAFNATLGRCCRGRIYQKTGCPGNAIYMPAKILWLREHRPDLFDTAPRFISIKEYVLWRLTGEWLADFGIASGGGLLNLHERQWDRELLQFLGITANQLSGLVDGPTTVRMRRHSVAAIGADIPLVVGSGDGQLANLGAGAYGSKQFVATIGSSGAIRAFVQRPTLDPRQRTWCYRLDGQTCLAGGAINNGGIVLKWLVEKYCQEEIRLAEGVQRNVYQIINDYVSGVPAGSNGLLFLPFLTGERSPDWNSMARGLIIGLGLSHSKKELIKAAMEGVVLRLYTNFLILQEMVGDTETVIVNGGFTRSPVWMQIMADVFGKTLLRYANTANSTLGAVVMGLRALGRVDAYDQVDLNLQLKQTLHPDSRNRARYQALHGLFEAVYSANKDLFKALQQLRENTGDNHPDHTEVLL